MHTTPTTVGGYHDTQDEQVYRAISRRLKDRFDIFGRLPDTIEDEWIEDVTRLEEMMDRYIDSSGAFNTNVPRLNLIAISHKLATLSRT